MEDPLIQAVEEPAKQGRGHRVGNRPGRKPGPVPQRTEKEIYDRTLNQVWRILNSHKTDPDLRARYHFAILRWQGKLDVADEAHLEELKKLMGKKAS